MLPCARNAAWAGRMWDAGKEPFYIFADGGTSLAGPAPRPYPASGSRQAPASAEGSGALSA